ncbi:hypothetical protein M3Y94_01054500 [Aphelenchoides besseyi]|nr:hypothetical protein M3Y94_01054500 [Aphelenchoides besseyi]
MSKVVVTYRNLMDYLPSAPSDVIGLTKCVIVGLLTVFVLRYLHCFIAFLVDLQHKRRLVRNIAGPSSWYLLGNMHQIPTDNKKMLKFLVSEAHKALAKGETVMKLWVGPKLLIVPIAPESIKSITMSNVELDKGEDYRYWRQWLGTGMLLADGNSQWHKMRKLVTPSFHFSRIENYVEAMDEHVRTMIELLHKRPAGEEVDLYPALKLCSLDIIADTVMGVRLNAQQDSESKYVHAVERFNYLGFVRQFRADFFLFGDFLWKLLGYKAEADTELNVLKSFTAKVVEERVEVFNDFKMNASDRLERRRLNFLDLLLELQSEGEITVDQVRDEVETFAFAGHDTTTHAVSWTMWALATNPNIQERLYREITEHFGHSDAEIHTTRIKDLSYLDMCIKEAMRLFAPIPLVQRYVKNDMQMDKYVIPGNTSVSISPYLLGHNPNVFEDHEKYDPERFADGKDYPFAAIAFSAGPRNCIGQKFAMREAKIIIAHLIYNFELTSKYKMEDNTPVSQIVLFPILGIPVHLPFLEFFIKESHKALEKDEPLMCFWVGPKFVVIPLENDAVKAITSSSVEINKGVDYAFFEQWLGDGLLLGNGQKWQNMRKMVTPAFHFGRVEEYAEPMNEHVRTMIELLHKQSTGEEVDLYPFIKLCSLDIILSCAMNVEIDAQRNRNHEYVHAVENFNQLGFLRSFRPQYFMFGGLFWKLMGYEAQTQQALRVLKNFSGKVVKERIEAYNDLKKHQFEAVEKKRLNFLDLMLENHAEQKISMKDLRSEIDTFLFAGHDTTTHAVAWTLWCLACHPDIQQKLYQEIMQHFGHSDAEIHTAKIKNLGYLDQCIKEAMRLYAPVPFLQRRTVNDVQMGKHTVPKNTTIGISPYVLHHNYKVFPNHRRYDPDRFAPDKEYPAHAYIPFLSGPRSCVGQKFAIREAKIMIAHLIYNFELSSDRPLEDNPGRPEVVLKPTLGVPVKLRSRF